ncbi:MAG: hypothetical protein ACD_79C00429G0001, partial [uncultured bacterium]
MKIFYIKNIKIDKNLANGKRKMTTDNELILILDFGSQYSQLIARRIREFGVYSEIKPCHEPLSEIIKLNPKGIILSGGPSSVYDKKAPKCDEKIFGLGIPILAICYGMQLITQLSGGKVERSDKAEYGRTEFFPDSKNVLFSGLPEKITVWMSHGDSVKTIPEGFIESGKSDNTPYASIFSESKKTYGLQFHPEVTHTDYGKNIIDNFLTKVCLCNKTWSMESFIDYMVDKIRTQVKTEKVICGLSGGVDSTVAAVLLHKAIGDNLKCIFVDNGVLRKDERDKVEKIFRNYYNINLTVVDAGTRFLNALKGVVDPEEKRIKIGHTFIDVFDECSKEFGKVGFLAQGTLYPDVIESVSPKGGPSAKIKSHHNVGGLPEKMKLSLVEPFRELFKD